MIMTDHLIQRRPPAGRPARRIAGAARPRSTAARSCPTILRRFPQTAENALYRAVAQVGLGNNVEAGLPELAREIEKQKPREAEFYIVLGDAWQSAGKNHAKPLPPIEQAVRLRPDSVRALRALAAALARCRAIRACRGNIEEGASTCAFRPRNLVPLWNAGFHVRTHHPRRSKDSESHRARSEFAREITKARRNSGEGRADPIAPRLPCTTRFASTPTMTTPGIWPAGFSPKRARSPKRCTISKERSACVPALRRISTTTRSRSPAPIDSTRRRSAPKPRCARMRILRKPMNCWAVSSRGSGNCPKLRANTGGRWSCGPTSAVCTCDWEMCSPRQGNVADAANICVKLPRQRSGDRPTGRTALERLGAR